jgi:predicted nucleic-acid-binding protein
MKWPKKVVDANVILRFFLADDEVQAGKAKRFFSDVESGSDQALLLDVVFAEVVWVLRKVYLVPREEIAEKFSELIGYKGLFTLHSKGAYLESLALYKEHSSIDIQDVLLAVLGRMNGCCVISFNGRDFRKLQSASEEP